MKVLFLAYRSWAIKIFDYVQFNPMVSSIRFITTENELLSVDLDKYDILLTAGWSDELPDIVANEIFSIGLHCAELDRYSYGTPIQLQIMDDITFTKHRIFKFEAKSNSNRAHTHNRLYSHEVVLDLSGSIDQIFSQLTMTGVTLFNMFLDDYPNISWKQWPEETIVKSKRTEVDSKLTKSDLISMDTVELYNFFRALEDPYPNGYIEDDLGKLFIKKVMFTRK